MQLKSGCISRFYLKWPQWVISRGERLHHRRRAWAEVGEVVAVATLDCDSVHQPLAWNPNLQLPKKNKFNHTMQSNQPHVLPMHGTV